VLSQPNDPLLLSGTHAVLIANTYHEFDDIDAILDRVFRSLVTRGRLVVDPMRTEHGTLTYLQA
jgi:ubiquinone/menaquinone biosynthesis C-methylase UbiE